MSTDPTGMEMFINAPDQESADADQWGAQQADNENKEKIASDGKDQIRKPSAEEMSKLVPLEVKRAILNALKSSNAPSGDDKKGGYHEEGGIWGPTDSGGTVVIPAQPGPYSRKGDTTAVIDEGVPADPKLLEHATGELGGKYHIHPKGGSDYGFVQPPSLGDIKKC